MKDLDDNFKNFSDAELVSFIKEGRHECLTALVGRYSATLNYYCSRYGLDVEKDDIAQEVTLAIYSSLDTFDEAIASFATFANVIIKRIVFSYLKKSSRKKAIPEEIITSFSEDNFDFADYNNPEKILIEKENYKNLQDTIRLELSKFEFKVLDLFLSGMSYEDISSVLNVTSKSVDNALSRIRKKLK